jgi:hypothetical protein
MIHEAIYEEAKSYTDVRWNASCNWDRDADGRITLEGAKKMLADLKCEGCEGTEMIEAVKKIRCRYELAAMLRAEIARWEWESPFAES